jgi:hypothetical protein
MKKNLLLTCLGVIMTLISSAQVLTDFDANQDVTFAGWPNSPVLVANPYQTGINTSANCGEFVRTTEQWAHAYAILSTPLDFTTNNTFKMKVYSPIACTILFKLENQGGAGTPTELSQPVADANTWVELTFPFSGATSGVYDKIVIFFDFATFADNTFYFDDVTFTSGGTVLNQINLPVTFDALDVNYTITDFGGSSSLLGEDPTNASNMVAVTTKNTGAETWAGTTIGTSSGFADAIPFTATETKMKVRVYAPAAGQPVRLKVEDKTDNTITCETEALTTLANAWETLEFDFSNPAAGTAAFNPSNTFDKASIFFDFGTTGSGAVYYWDDVEFGGLIGIENPSANTISLYPNPVSEELTINGLENETIIRIYTVTGTLVMEQTSSSSNNSLNLTALPTGMYLVGIQTGSETTVQRLIKK